MKVRDLMRSIPRHTTASESLASAGRTMADAGVGVLPVVAADRRVEPFVLLAAGFAYEKDRTTLTLRNDYLDESLRVDHDGTYPVATVGIGVDIPLTRSRTTFLQVGTAYFWGRLEEEAAAQGSLAPAPQVTADTDSTGPNYWIGLSWRLGAAH